MRFGPLGMIDRSFGRRTANEAWSLSPPQHIPEAVRADLLPDTLFDAIFSTVRHPLNRLRSVFLFQREVEKSLPPALDFRKWIDGIPRVLALDSYALHGHLLPMSNIVPKSAKVFRIEDGLNPLVMWLDDLAGNAAGAREMPKRNVLKERLTTGEVPKIQYTSEIVEQVADIYGNDYTRFGYEILPADNPQTRFANAK